MNRLESIKERLSDLDAGKIVKYDNTRNLATQYMNDYKNDTEYLLQRLERYEKALEDAKQSMEPYDNDLDAYSIILDALDELKE